MTVNELRTILEHMPQDDLICVQTIITGFSACCSVVSDCGITYVRDHVLTRKQEMVTINGMHYEVTSRTFSR